MRAIDPHSRHWLFATQKLDQQVVIGAEVDAWKSFHHPLVRRWLVGTKVERQHVGRGRAAEMHLVVKFRELGDIGEEALDSDSRRLVDDDANRRVARL